MSLSSSDEAVHFGHIDVGQDDADAWIFEEFRQSLEAVVGKDEVVLATSDLFAKALPDKWFEVHLIVNYHNFDI